MNGRNAPKANPNKRQWGAEYKMRALIARIGGGAADVAEARTILGTTFRAGYALGASTAYKQGVRSGVQEGLAIGVVANEGLSNITVIDPRAAGDEAW